MQGEDPESAPSTTEAQGSPVTTNRDDNPSKIVRKGILPKPKGRRPRK